MKKIIQTGLRRLGYQLTPVDIFDFYHEADPAGLLYGELSPESKLLVAPFLPHSRAQLAQDIFALAESRSSSPKFFVEFGATDGVTLSNTWLLENHLGWHGILAEPASTWHDDLAKNRNCQIDFRCVARASGQRYRFLEVKDGTGSPELSSIEAYANNGDKWSQVRVDESTSYEVETVSLVDLLDAYDAPEEIQFLSVDTEGSEFEILEGYDFSGRFIHSICVEHNYQSSVRRKIQSLLLAQGYQRVFQRVSRIDDWYVLPRY